MTKTKLAMMWVQAWLTAAACALLAACGGSAGGESAARAPSNEGAETRPAEASTSVACAYVTAYGGERVCGLRVPSGDALGCVRTGPRPHGAALSPDGARLYISNEGADTVSVIDAASLEVVSTIEVGREPNQIALTPDSTELWVTNHGSDTVSVIDTASERVIQSVPVGRAPHIIAMSPATGQVLVTSEGDGAVDILDAATRQRVRRVRAFGFPRVLAVSPTGEHAYLTLRWLNGLLQLDLTSGRVTDRVSLGEPDFAEEGKDAHGVAVSADGRRILLTTQTSGRLSWIDAAELDAGPSIHVGTDPNWVALTTDERFAVVSNTGDGNAVVVDLEARAIVATAPIGPQPKRLVVGACPPSSPAPRSSP